MRASLSLFAALGPVFFALSATAAPASVESTKASKVIAPIFDEEIDTSNVTIWGKRQSVGEGAPHFVLYCDEWAQVPNPQDASGWNVINLAFYILSGPTDDALWWQGLDAGAKQSMIDGWHQAGIKVMLSAFGATEKPTTSGVDATDLAHKMAQSVKDNSLDGIDIDYEDLDAINSGAGEAWLITLTQTLRADLPAPYLISHAPIAPWFRSDGHYPGGGYTRVDQEVGSLIDFYNIQFYNQDRDYMDCNSLFHDSGSEFPNTSVFQIHDNSGVPLDKLVVGKPGAASDAINGGDGYMDPGTLGSCMQDAVGQGWRGGIMSWEYPRANSDWINTAKGGAF